MGRGVFEILVFLGCGIYKQVWECFVVDFGSFWVLSRSFPSPLSSGSFPFLCAVSPSTPLLSSLASVQWVGVLGMGGKPVTK